MCTFNFKPITPSRAFEIIKGAKKTKSTGIDPINTFFLKLIPRESAYLITHLFNSIIATGIFPDCLKTAKVYPLRKKGKDQTLMSSYRPISNLSCIDKMIEQELKCKLENYLDSNNLISNGNHGGRRGHSTLSAISIIQDD